MCTMIYWNRLILAVVICSMNTQLVSGVGTIALGSLFDIKETDPMKQVAFRYAIDLVNSDSRGLTSRIAPQVERVPASDSFHTAKRVCHLLKLGVAAILGPSVEPTASHVQSICDTKSLPHIETRWQYRSPDNSFFVNLFPYSRSLSMAFADVLKVYRWSRFFVLYEDNDSLSRLQEVLKLADTSSRLSILVRQLPADGDFRELLKSIQNSGGTHLVVDCTSHSIYQLLKHAQQIGMITRHYHFFFTSLDLHTVDLEDFQFAGTNITGVRLVDTGDLQVISTVEQWRNAEASQGRNDRFTAAKLSTEAALVYDAVLLFAKAANDLHSSRDIAVTSLSCDADDLWQHGESLLNYMQLVEIDGLSGHVKFDTHGRRSSFSLEILSLVEQGLLRVGTWTPEGITVSGRSNFSRTTPSIKNQNLIVTTLLKSPYTMLKESSAELVGNDRFEGMCVDLIEELSRSLQFNYTIRLAEDNAPGQYDAATARWNGMIGELLDGRADLAIADLTITSEREAVVDFTMQFMNLGISILYRKPTRQPPSLFSFLAPLSPYVWLYMAAATMGVSILMFVLARFTPYEWEPPHPCAPDQDHLENNFNMHNCVWFCIGSLMQQGCDFLPKAMSTRMVAGIWWFFTLIMISSYTANLAAFLTVERMVSPIESAEDMASQNTIKYGVYQQGSTAAFFKNSKLHPYNKMWRVMEDTSPSVFMGSDEGIKRVKDDNGLYAYFMESSTIEYVVERECELTQIGGLLDNKGYGIALPPDSPWTSQLNQQLLHMQEKGHLARLKKQWWSYEGHNCEDDGGGSMASALDLENVGGVFVCLLGGMIVATVMAVVEFIFHMRSKTTEGQTPIISAMCRELRDIIKCRGSRKPSELARTCGDELDGGLMPLQDHRTKLPSSGNTLVTSSS